MANVEQIIIKDSGGTEADVTASNALKVDNSAVTQPISGTVTINAIPAGTNNIGDVDVLTVPADPFGVNADASSATGSISAKLRFIASTGIPITGTVTVGSHAVTNAGTFPVQIDGAALTSLQLADDVVAVLGTDTYTEASTKGTVIGAVRRDADTTLVNTTNEIGPLQMDANGRLKVEVFSGETLPVSMTSTTITGSVAVTQSGTWDEVGINDSGNSITIDAPVGTPAFVRLSDGAAAITTLPVSLASVPSHAVTNAGVFAVQVDGAALTSLQLADDVVAVLGTDTYTEATSKGTIIAAVRRDADTTLANTTNEYSPLQTDARGCLKVEAFSGEALPITDNASSITVDAPTGTPVNVQIGNATLTVGVIDETGASAVDALAVGGGTAHDAVDSGNPIKMGAKALSALPTAVASADRVNNIADLFGRQLTSHIDPAMQVAITKTAFNTTSTATGGAMWTPTSGKRIALTSLVIGTYGTTAARVIIWFGGSGDTTYSAGTDQAVVAASFAPSATVKPGLVLTPAVPIFCTTADNILRITTDAAISIDVTWNGYEY